MIAAPSLAAAQLALAEAEARWRAASARLEALTGEERTLAVARAQGPATLEAMTKLREREAEMRHEKAIAAMEITEASASIKVATHRLKTAEVGVELRELESDRDAIAAKIGREFPPLANAIVALMATNWRLRAIVDKLNANPAAVPVRLRQSLITPDFCGAVRLLNLTPSGVAGYVWHSGAPAELDRIKTPDAISLDEIRQAALTAPERAGAVALEAEKALAFAYMTKARGILALLKQEFKFIPALERGEIRRISVARGSHFASPAQIVTEGRIRVLAQVTSLPALGGHGVPLWAHGVGNDQAEWDAA